MNKSQQALITAYEKGYRVRNGCVLGIQKKQPLKLRVSSFGYLYFRIKLGKTSHNVYLHRLVAYEKYKDKLFIPGIVVRHLNGNPKDNSFENICIGTTRQNIMDRKPEDRLQHAIKASRSIRKFTNEQVSVIREEHKLGVGYKFLMEKYKINSKGTLHYILNSTYVT
jgi:hypothetical protein